MTLAIIPEHQQLAEVVGDFVRREHTREAARNVLSQPDGDNALWAAVCEQGWPALFIPEEYGGLGFELVDSAMIVHGLAAGIVPGRLFPSLVASATLVGYGDDSQRARWLPGLAQGTQAVSFSVSGSPVRSTDGRLESFDGLAVGAVGSRVHLVRADRDVIIVMTDTPLAPVQDALDPGLGAARLQLERSSVVEQTVLEDAGEFLTAVARLLAACEAAGGAATTLEIALDHAKRREQFGRIIGGFQAVKHQLATMRMNSELAVGAAWGAAQLSGRGPEGQLAAAIGASVALESYEANARKLHQILGAIGFTWEHDAHLFLRRASSWSVLLGAGSTTTDDVTRLVAWGVRPVWDIQFPDEAQGYRRAVLEFVDAYQAAPEDRRRMMLVESGYLVPHWPKPWGRDAGPIEQLVIEEGTASLAIPDLDINGWVLLTLVHTATPEQLDRWIVPGLLDEAPWCQMFSETEAGWDAAAARTKGVRVDGGWRVSGQKMWTTAAQHCRWGLATVRTDPSESKHAGLTMMGIDLTSPGVTIRPIIEITGSSTINEIYLDDVFIPDDDVVGDVGAGWLVARATLRNERVSIGGRRALGYSAASVVPMLQKYAPDDSHLARDLGRLLARETAMHLINVRQVMRMVDDQSTTDLGAVTKVLSSEHLQAVTELGLRITGVVGDERRMRHEFLFNRCLTIAGGSSEIGRNVIAERLLGLPREPSSAKGPDDEL